MAESTAGVAEGLEQGEKQHRKFPVRLLIPLGLIAVGIGIWRITQPTVNPNVMQVSGRIEADETDIGAKTGGRVSAIAVHEGDTVKAGQLIAEITDEEVPEQLRAAAAQAAAARQEEQQAKLDIAVAETQVLEAQASLQQSKGDVRGRVNQAEANVATAQGQLAEAQAQAEQAKAQVVQAQAQVDQAKAQERQARSTLKRAQISRDRYAKLLAQGAVNQDQFEQMQTTLETAQAAVDNAQAAIRTATAGVATARATQSARESAVRAAQTQIAANQGSLEQTQATAFNPTIRNQQLEAAIQQKQQAYARLGAAQAKVKNALAAQAQIQRRIESFKVKSPINGVVQSRPVEPGAVVATGKTLLTLINPQAVYLRGFIPEGDIGKVAVGMKAQVFLDSSPNQPLQAQVTSIDPQASFTPENTYFKDDRVRQVFGVKLAIMQSGRLLAKPGMPADAEILLK